MAENLSLSQRQQRALGSLAVATPVFPATIFAFQRSFARLGLAAHQYVLGTVGGLLAVTVASTATAAASLTVQQTLDSTTTVMTPSNLWQRSFLTGVVYFLVGSSPRRVLPSHSNHTGAFAYESLPAGIKYKTPREARVIDRIGFQRGCHSCGSRREATFVGDHQPPKSFNKPNMRFYPHCTACSNTQGGRIAGGSTSRAGFMTRHHWTTFFLPRYWLPLLLAQPLAAAVSFIELDEMNLRHYLPISSDQEEWLFDEVNHFVVFAFYSFMLIVDELLDDLMGRKPSLADFDPDQVLADFTALDKIPPEMAVELLTQRVDQLKRQEKRLVKRGNADEAHTERLMAVRQQLKDAEGALRTARRSL